MCHHILRVTNQIMTLAPLKLSIRVRHASMTISQHAQFICLIIYMFPTVTCQTSAVKRHMSPYQLTTVSAVNCGFVLSVF